MRVLGIDPGLRLTGYGCVEGDPVRPKLVEAGVIRLQSGSADTRPIADRLIELERDLDEIIERLRPDAVGLEGLFAHYKHPATAVVMAHGRGVSLLVAARRGLAVTELKPAEAKRALAGHGRATKEQMQRAAQGLFGLAQPPTPADIADALGIAVCALRRSAVTELTRAAPTPSRAKLA